MTEKFGFIYVWYDKLNKMYYIGSHWGTEDDGYICSSRWMKNSYKQRPADFKRRIVKKIYTNKINMLEEENRWIKMIDPIHTVKFNKNIDTRKQNVRYYNINLNVNNKVWHSYPEKVKTIGKKISFSKVGKKVKPCTPERAKAVSEGKIAAFEKRQKDLGYKVTPETLKKMSEVQRGKKHTEQWKEEQSIRSQEMWNNGSRKRVEPKQTMTIEEQAKHISIGLKNRWADPVWAANQRKRLSEGAKNRPPRTAESKLKASIAQKGVSKPRKYP